MQITFGSFDSALFVEPREPLEPWEKDQIKSSQPNQAMWGCENGGSVSILLDSARLRIKWGGPIGLRCVGCLIALSDKYCVTGCSTGSTKNCSCMALPCGHNDSFACPTELQMRKEVSCESFKGSGIVLKIKFVKVNVKVFFKKRM